MSEITGNVYTQNRDLSYLRFCNRILDKTLESDLPILERLNFLSIYSSNIDEFLMIRIGSLSNIYKVKADATDWATGNLLVDQFEILFKYIKKLNEKAIIAYQTIMDDLKHHDITVKKYEELDSNEKKVVKKYYYSKIKMNLSPSVIDNFHPFPHVNNLQNHLGLVIKREGRQTFGLLPIPQQVEPFIVLDKNSTKIIFMEEVISNFADDLFTQYEILNKAVFNVVRNADLVIEDEFVEAKIDLSKKMRRLLKSRDRLLPVGLKIEAKASPEMVDFLTNKLELTNSQVFKIHTITNGEFINKWIKLLSTEENSNLFYDTFEPAYPKIPDQSISLINLVKSQDLLHYYPYQSMELLLNLIKEAANNDDVISIKITIYRLASTAKLIDYLVQASENGKEVTVVIELRARFDEQNNIDWSERLIEAGCRVIYGFEKYKIHSKVMLITMLENNEIKYISQAATGNYNERTVKQYSDISLITANFDIELRARFDEQNNIDWSERLIEAGCRVIYGFEKYKIHSKVMLITMLENNEIKYISQAATGNYNERTVKQYSDISLITANFDIGQEVSQFFNEVATNNISANYSHLLVAPHSFKDRLTALIDEEIKKGSDGYILFKVNALSYSALIDKLVEASQAGVKIEIIARSIVCLLPGIEGYSNNIVIKSLMGRFLEHARTYVFGKG